MKFITSSTQSLAAILAAVTLLTACGGADESLVVDTTSAGAASSGLEATAARKRFPASSNGNSNRVASTSSTQTTTSTATTTDPVLASTTTTDPVLASTTTTDPVLASTTTTDPVLASTTTTEPISTSTTTTTNTLSTSTVVDSTITAPTATTTANTTTTPLNALVPTNFEGNGYDGSYSGQTITGPDGLARIQKMTGFENTGKTVYLHRTKLGDALNWSGHRSEFSWYGHSPVMQLGTDYWFAFAIRPLSGEWHSTTGNYADQQIIFQIHQLASIGNGPTFGLKTVGGNNSLEIEGNYGSAPQSNSRTIKNFGANSSLTVGSWNRFIVHLRLGDSSFYAPRIEVWRDGTKILDLSGSSAYLSGVDSGSDYPKIGIYKWNEANYDNPITRAAYYSELYFGEGTNLLNEASASLAPYN